VAEVLELAQLVQDDRVAEVDVGAVGSSPSLMRSGTPVASERASFRSHSSSGKELAAAAQRPRQGAADRFGDG
jgi:hypothetical protein